MQDCCGLVLGVRNDVATSSKSQDRENDVEDGEHDAAVTEFSLNFEFFKGELWCAVCGKKLIGIGGVERG